jgi:hypothetical protein
MRDLNRDTIFMITPAVGAGDLGQRLAVGLLDAHALAGQATVPWWSSEFKLWCRTVRRRSVSAWFRASNLCP